MEAYELVKNCGIIKSRSRKTGKLVAVAARKNVDRDGEVILPRAFEKRLDVYLSNPVMLWEHDNYGLPIGKAENIEISDDEMTFKPVFAKKQSDFADTVYNLYLDGFLNAFSIRAMVHDVSDEPVLEGQKGATITDAELLEISSVNIPANQEALMRAAKSLRAVAKHADRLILPEYRQSLTRTGMVRIRKTWKVENLEEAKNLIKQLETLSGELTGMTTEDNTEHEHEIFAELDEGKVVSSKTTTVDEHWHEISELELDGRGVLGPALDLEGNELEEQHSHSFVLEIPEEEESEETEESVTEEPSNEDENEESDNIEAVEALVADLERMLNPDIDGMVEKAIKSVIRKNLLEGESK